MPIFRVLFDGLDDLWIRAPTAEEAFDFVVDTFGVYSDPIVIPATEKSAQKFNYQGRTMLNVEKIHDHWFDLIRNSIMEVGKRISLSEALLNSK